MPKDLKNKLRRQGKKKGFTGERLSAYIYGTMNKLGYMHGNKRTKKKAGDYA